MTITELVHNQYAEHGKPVVVIWPAVLKGRLGPVKGVMGKLFLLLIRHGVEYRPARKVYPYKQSGQLGDRLVGEKANAEALRIFIKSFVAVFAGAVAQHAPQPFAQLNSSVFAVQIVCLFV